MRSIEGINKSISIWCSGPARRLHRARNFERQLAEMPIVCRRLSFAHQPPPISIGGNIIEAMVVHPNVRNVARHELDRAVPPHIEERFFACRIVLQKRGAKLKSLRPLGPS